MSPLYLLYSVYIPFYKKVNYEVVTVATTLSTVHSSVVATSPDPGFPPLTIVDVLFPAGAPFVEYLAVDMSLTSVQLEPFQDSVFATPAVTNPPA